jgi:uncharacterized protein YndB with AHSA1/START domain
MTQAAMKTATQDIVVEDVFPHAPETVWKTLTTGELIGRWHWLWVRGDLRNDR